MTTPHEPARPLEVEATSPDGQLYNVGPVYSERAVGELIREIQSAGWTTGQTRSHVSRSGFRDLIRSQRRPGNA